jgi:hypothetical protein
MESIETLACGNLLDAILACNRAMRELIGDVYDLMRKGGGEVRTGAAMMLPARR